jgi:HD-GYP domain-containing protein (c-di-GMP phosphodiesterase class II)
MNQEKSVPQLVDFLHALSQSLTMSSLYTPDHPMVTALLPRLLDNLNELLLGTTELTLIIFNDDILYQGKPLARDVNLAKLAKHFNRTGVGHVNFEPGVAAEDLRAFINALSTNADLEVFKSGSSRIRIGVVSVDDQGGDGAEMISSYGDISPERLQSLQSFYDAIGDREQLDMRQLMSLVAGFIVAFRREFNPLMALVPIRNLDDYTFTHSINVGILNIAQGMSLGISGELLHDLGVAGMLHDSGKIYVDRAIIQKPGKLSEAELAVMQTHPARGAQYLMGQEGVPKLAVISAYEHHMRFDRKGYPHPPDGWTLNLCSLMTMISDTFDALRTRRVYKDPWDFPAVCGHMLTLAGSQLQGDLVVNFLDLLARQGDGLPPSQLEDSVPARESYCE